VVASGALFAVNGTVSKLVLRAGMDAPQLTTLRATGAFVGLLALTLTLGANRLRFTRRELPLPIGYGLAASCSPRPPGRRGRARATAHLRFAPERPIRQDRSMQLHPNAQAVQDALGSASACDAEGRPSTVRILPDAVHTAVAAAAALGVQVGQIANSLIFDADGEALLVLTSGAHRVDTAKVAGIVGAQNVRRATPDFVRRHTGQVIGGVAPVGHPKQVRTLVDTALGGYDQIWAAGGIPQAVFPVTYAELLRITSGSPAEVA
jgi:prolyl-tRNA editing enzyme YbaK/EbsC (Cys-tRNA(Pro) deacylase)